MDNIKMKIGIVSPEPIGDCMSGIGIRMLEISKVLSRENDVILFVPKESKPVKVNFSIKGYKKEAISEFLKDIDLVIIQGEPANYLLSQNFKGYVIVDLYDPYAIESLSYDDKAFEFAHSSLSFQLKKGMHFLCANEKQRIFYLGGLFISKRLEPEIFQKDPEFKSLISIVPYGVPEEEPILEENYFNFKEPVIFFGSFYDWYDIEILEEVLLELKKEMEFHFIVTKHLRPSTTPQKKFKEFEEWSKKEGLLDKNIHIIDWMPYNERTKAYFSSSLSLCLYPESFETELSFRTRILDFLYGGLPVIALKGSQLEKLISEVDGAFFVERERGLILKKIKEIIKIDKEKRIEFSKNIRKKFGWEVVLKPLLDYISKLKPLKKEKRKIWEKILR